VNKALCPPLLGYAIWAGRRYRRQGHLFLQSDPPVAETGQLAGLDARRIFAAVTSLYGLDDQALSRRYDLHVARAVAASLCRRHTEATLRELAASLGLSRPDSVPNLTRRIETWLKTSPELSNNLAEILKRASSPETSDDQDLAKLSKTRRQSPRSKTKNQGCSENSVYAIDRTCAH
jgi:hypothetical protein